MNWGGGFGGGAGDRVQFLQAQLFPVCTITANNGFLGSFLSNNLKTNQLEVNTDAQTLKPIARLKEPRDLFALPKDRDHDCPQQTARWPTECQVLDERIFHIEYVPPTPEPYYQPTGRELQPRPVGDENGAIIYTYNPISAVNYSAYSPAKPSSQSNDRSSSTDDEDEENDDDDTAAADDRGGSLSSDSRTPSPLLSRKKPNPNIEEFSQRFCDSLSVSTETTTSDDDAYKSLIDSSEDPKLLPTNDLTLRTCNGRLNLKDAKCYSNETLIQFSRSSVGGSKYLMAVHPNSQPDDGAAGELLFESRFESGNLAKAVKITPVYYELYLRSDMYTNRHSQWFYFRVMNTRKGIPYRLSIVNLVKSGSLYNEGMKPLMYSTMDAKSSSIGWRRCGENISYFKNDDLPVSNEDDDDYGFFTLTFNIEFPHDNDTVYFAHSYPYTYSDLQDYLMEIQRHPIKSKYCKLRLLCRSLAGNNVYYLTVTAPSVDEDFTKKKRAIVVSARVHPGETPASWMMKGLMDFITGDSFVAKKLRHKFIFKLIPMLNPDGVIVGNTRSSLTGKDLNRQYRTVIRETYPSIWYTKTMIKRLTDECGVVMYCDMHAHSRRHNIFIYGCENKRTPDKKLTEQVFPLMLHKNVADKFSFENCKFKVQRNKEGTGRIVVWMQGVTNSYTMEASFGGSTLGSRNATHFSTADYEHIGRAFCETLMDYSDENPIKEKLRAKIVNRLNQEGSNADEPLNIPLSDYSSDEGDTSSSSSSENEGKVSSRPYEGPCCPALKVPPSSPVMEPSNPKQQTDKKVKKLRHKATKRDDATAATTTKKHHPRKSTRSYIDLPTAEPELDFTGAFNSSDEELGGTGCGVGAAQAEIDGYETVPKTYRNMLRADIKRTETQTKRMPPELIITPAQRGNTPDINGERDKGDRSELPPICSSSAGRCLEAAPAKRNQAWHSFKKCVPSLRVANLNYDHLEAAENLQLKLSLKKQIWTGATSCDNGGDRARPLSWGALPVVRRKAQSSAAVAFDADNTDLLLACSQKLAAWQLESEKQTKEKNRSLKACLKTKNYSKHATKHQATSVNVFDSPYNCNYHNEKRDQQQQHHQQANTPSASHGKKKSHMSRLADTTHLLANLANRASKSSYQRKPKATGTTVGASPNETGGTIISSVTSKLRPSRYTPSRFKTGGIVATAVQPSKRTRKHHHHHHQHTATTMGHHHPTGRAVQPKPTLPLPIMKHFDTDTEASNVKEFVKKVKTKMKKKTKGKAACAAKA